MANQPSQVIVLCEDIQQRVFIYRYLTGVGHSRYVIRVRPLPDGRGAGEAYVKSLFVQEVKVCRQRNSHTATWLVVIIDADLQTCNARRQELMERLTEDCVAPLSSSDPVVIFLPKRNIETWIRALSSEAVDEVTAYQKFQGGERRCWAAVDFLVDRVRNGAGPIETWPPSLRDSYESFVRLRAR